MCRLFIFNAVIGYLYSQPIIQGVVITVLTLLMLLYLVVVQPMKSRLDLIRSFMQELVLLIVNVCVTGLAYMDHNITTDNTNQTRVHFGDIIMWCNVAFSIISLVYVTIRIVQQMRPLYYKACTWYRSKASEAAPKRQETVEDIKNTGDKPMTNTTNVSHIGQLNSSMLDKSQAGLLSINSSSVELRKYSENSAGLETETRNASDFRSSLLPEHLGRSIRQSNQKRLKESIPKIVQSRGIRESGVSEEEVEIPTKLPTNLDVKEILVVNQIQISQRRTERDFDANRTRILEDRYVSPVRQQPNNIHQNSRLINEFYYRADMNKNENLLMNIGLNIANHLREYESDKDDYKGRDMKTDINDSKLIVLKRERT